MDNQSQAIKILQLDEYRYEIELRHVAKLANTPGCKDYAIHKAERYAEKMPRVYSKLPAELRQYLKELP